MAHRYTTEYVCVTVVDGMELEFFRGDSEAAALASCVTYQRANPGADIRFRIETGREDQ